jgi:CheY-like chemotaxis protein
MQTSGLALTTLVAVDIASPHSAYESVGTNAGVAVQDLDRDTAKELGVKGKYKVARMPDIVLLDINMPKMNGYEVLERMKKDPRLQSLPVIMLTMSEREEDVVRAYTNGACSFIHKPVDLDQFRERLKQFEHYWTGVSRVPVVRE